MIDKLLALRSLVIPDRPQPVHAALDHVHWDAAARTWRAHPQPKVAKRRTAPPRP
jgi:hypothetical protein